MIILATAFLGRNRHVLKEIENKKTRFRTRNQEIEREQYLYKRTRPDLRTTQLKNNTWKKREQENRKKREQENQVREQANGKQNI